MSVFWLWREIIFGDTYVLTVQCKMACRNSFFEGTENGQMTPHGYPNFSSYMKNLRFLVLQMDRQRDGQRDRGMEKFIQGGDWVA